MNASRITEHFYVIKAQSGLEERFLIVFFDGRLADIGIEFGLGKYVRIASFNPFTGQLHGREVSR